MRISRNSPQQGAGHHRATKGLGKKRKPGSPKNARKEFMDERRRLERQPIRGSIKFTVVREGMQSDSMPSETLQAEVVDVSETGLGLRIETSLEPGQVIKFVNTDLEWQLPESGVVVWTTESPDGYRAGIKFN